MISSLLLSSLLLFGTSLATCKYKFIHNASELIEFSNDVNNGTTYEGYTAYLVADIIFDEESSKQYDPIGIDMDKSSFDGTFDGQGYAISNLTMNSSSHQFVGLFGNSNGVTIKNVVVDDSCSFSSYYSGSTYTYLYVTGIINHCTADHDSCIYENIVNMADICYSGDSGDLVWVGGISGIIGILDSNHKANIINCVNYGNVYNSKSGYSHLYMGGIIAEVYPRAKNYVNFVYNCINYGAVLNTGTSKYYHIGGIVGYSWGLTIENCVNVGAVTSAKGSVGGIIGQATTTYDTTITHCYWATDGCSKYYASSSHISSSSSEINGITSTSITSDNANWLNIHATDNEWNEWTYNQNKAKISFVAHDGKGFSYPTLSPLVLLPVAERRGYAFLFWCVNENATNDCSKKYDRTMTNTLSSSTTLYAQWVVTNCTVTFDVNGGYELPENERNRTKVFEQKIGELPVTSRRGYTFTGWFTAYGEYFTKESLVNNVCNCSLIANWDPNNYTVTLDVNGGDKLANNTFTVTFDSTYSNLPIPTRDGFNFSGWLTKEGEEIKNETIVNITDDQTLYANWTAREFTVTLDVNGGEELEESEKTKTVPADKAYELLPTPTRKGYKLAGWFTEDGGLITNDIATTAIISRDQTLHAEWIPNNYTVSFDVNVGDELTDEDKNKTVTYDSTYGSLPMPTKTGYTFSGWFTDGREEVTNTTAVAIIKDQILYAEWVANNYTISFNVNGGNDLSNITVTFDSNYTCLPTPSKEGYTFLWWYIEDTKEKVDNETKVETACNHTLCAAWNKNTVFFDVNGGDELDKSEKEQEVIYDGTYDTLPTPTKKGYTFDGWFTEDGEKIVNGDTITISYEQVIRAEWTANNYTMKLDVSGGDELNEKNITVTYEGTYGYIPEPTRTGYTFVGWYTENNELVTSESTVTDACSCTLHANWTANTYIITLVVNGGDELGEDEKNITVTYDDTYGSLPTPTRPGYTFIGWFNEDGEVITNETKVLIEKNQTLHAEWTKIATSEVTTPTKYIEIVFEKKGLTDDEIRDIVKKFTDAKITITRVEDNNTGEVRVIVKFVDAEKAKQFITALNESSDSAKHFIRGASFNSWVDGSFSAMICPFMVLSVLLI